MFDPPSKGGRTSAVKTLWSKQKPRFLEVGIGKVRLVGVCFIAWVAEPGMRWRDQAWESWSRTNKVEASFWTIQVHAISG